MIPYLDITTNDDGTFSVYDALRGTTLAVCQTMQTAMLVARCIAATKDYHFTY